MKPMAMVWLGVAGLALFLLLGQLFSAYPEMRAGVVRVFVLLAIGAATVGAVNVALFAAGQEAGEITGAILRTPITASGLAVAGLLGVLLLVMAVGGL